MTDSTGSIYSFLCRKVNDKEIICKVYLDRLINVFPQDYVLENASRFFLVSAWSIFGGSQSDKEYAHSLVKTRLMEEISSGFSDENHCYENMKELIRLSKGHLEGTSHNEIVSLLSDSIPNDVYVKLWLEELVIDFPFDHIVNLNKVDKNNDWTLLAIFLLKAYHLKEAMKGLVIRLKEEEENDRPSFYRKYWSIWGLLLSVGALKQIPELGDEYQATQTEELSREALEIIQDNDLDSFPFFRLLLWHLDLTDTLDFDYFKEKFVYFLLKRSG